MSIVTALALGLGGWWVQNMWNSVEAERKAREAMLLSISNTFATKESVSAITQQLNHTAIETDSLVKDIVVLKENQASILTILKRIEIEHKRVMPNE